MRCNARYTVGSGETSQTRRQRRQAPEAASSANPWAEEPAYSPAAAQPRDPTVRGVNSDHSRGTNINSRDNSHSSSRSISQHSMTRRADEAYRAVLNQLDGFSTPLTPTLLGEAHTPDWLHDGALTASESGSESNRTSHTFSLNENPPHLPDSISAQNGFHTPLQAVGQPPEQGFGTWAGRQKHFGAPSLTLAAEEEEAPASMPFVEGAEPSKSNGDGPANGSSRGGTAGSSHPVDASIPLFRDRDFLAGSVPNSGIPGVPIPKPGMATAAVNARGAGSGGSAESSFDDNRARNAAWRWRFGRRWRAEQAKQLDPAYGQEPGDEDTWDEALGYLDACGGGYRLQIARTESMDRTLEHSVMGSSQMLLDDDSYAEGALMEAADLDATKQIGAMAKKAQELMHHQEEIEKRVSQRWGDVSTAGDSWAGHYLPAVQVDTYGSFPFVLLKVVDRSGVNKLLVRGKNYNSEALLLQTAHKEVALVCSTRRVPPVTTELIGGGLMEWSRERDRYLNVSEGRVVQGSHTSVQTKGDVARLAGALTRCSLPMHYHITVEGQKLM